MKHFYYLSLLFFIVSGMAQNPNAQKQYPQVPLAYQSHPELGKTTHSVALNEVDYELVQDRTRYSRTFLNTNKTKTTVQSSVPLHYQGADGLWHTIDYKLSHNGDKIVYPVQEPFLEFGNGNAAISVGDQKINMPGGSNVIFISNGNEVSKKLTTIGKEPNLQNDNEILFKDVAAGIDKKMTVYHQAVKFDYMIKEAAFLPASLDYMVVEEVMDLPGGYAMHEEKFNDMSTNRLVITNRKGEEVLVFQQPIISDSKAVDPKFRYSFKPYEAKFQLVKVGDTRYKIQIKIDGSWLKSADRVFPVTIDPVVVTNDGQVVNSCYFPSYQQATLQVAVPAGQTILATDISYNFIAVNGSGSWMSDQRSYVSGPDGQTPVTSGIGNNAGTYTYNLTNSPIANVVSTGLIDYTFNFSREWGGSGCNATYDFVNSRQVSVTYGTIEFGNGPLVINEYSASNKNFLDGFGRTEDWIELYNESPDTYFNLAGYYLSNNADNPTKWQIQNGVIPPHSRVLVFCSNRDISSGTVLHANFNLTQLKPDDVVLADPSGNILESHVMFATQSNHSYGRTTDGAATWSIFSTATPGAANANGYSAYASKPVLSAAPGRYTAPVTVAMSSAGTNEQIRYTTNGSTPTLTSTLYTAPFVVSQSTVVRARAFSTQPGILPGFIETNTYFLNENSSLPVFSFSGDADLQQLFDGSASLLPMGSFEYFESDGTFVDESVGDFNKHGNDSWAYGQRGVDFVTRDDYGYNRKWNHKFFNSTNRTDFKWLIVKPAASDNYPFQSGGAHMRDAFAHTLSQTSHLELDERSCTFINLFVNGQYWGVYDLRERVDDNDYTDHYYDQDYTFRDSDIYLQYLKTWGSTENRFGNQPATDDWQALIDFVQNNDMSVNANYTYVDSQLNIDSMIDYFVLNSYLVNHDWLNWNTSWWRGLDPTGGAQKWRYALWDLDGILGHYINYTGVPDISANAPPCQAENLTGVGVGHTEIMSKLIDESPIVRQKYVTRYADLLNTGFSCEHVTQVFDSIVGVLTPEMPRHIQRWGGNMATWQANVLAARNFLLQRCSQTISSGLVSCYNVTGPYATTFDVWPANSGKIKMNSEWLLTYPHTAQVFGNIETLLKAEANPGYIFDHWVVNGAVIQPNAQAIDIILQISQATSVTAYFKDVVNNGEDPIYYWHFNTLETPTDVVTIPADYSIIPSAAPMMTYIGTGPRDIDANATGSELNLHLNELSGKCARVRNPSDTRALVFDLPTQGYKNIKFAYAVQRTNQGQLINNVSYSTDGVNYTQAGLTQTAFNVSTDFSLVDIDFTSITAVNNNPNFKVQITFEGNTTADTGNNRFDNVTMKGIPFTLAVQSQNATAYQIFPNPFTSNLQIITNDQMTGVSVYDMLGKIVWQKEDLSATSETIELGGLAKGIYMLKVKMAGGVITHKIVKQ